MLIPPSPVRLSKMLSAVLAFWLGVKHSQVYQTEKQAYSNTQLPKRGFDAQRDCPSCPCGLAFHISSRFRKLYHLHQQTSPRRVALPGPFDLNWPAPVPETE